MTTIRMTKRFVADVLKKEPLGRFTRLGFIEGDYDVPISDPECTSCAVGTVIRGCLLPSTTVEQSGDVVNLLTDPSSEDWTEGQIDPDGNPWLMLSRTYETTVAQSAAATMGGRLSAGRRAAVRYVEKHFPSHVTLDINGYKARKARGVTVVKRKAKR